MTRASVISLSLPLSLLARTDIVCVLCALSQVRVSAIVLFSLFDGSLFDFDSVLFTVFVGFGFLNTRLFSMTSEEGGGGRGACHDLL